MVEVEFKPVSQAYQLKDSFPACLSLTRFLKSFITVEEAWKSRPRPTAQLFGGGTGVCRVWETAQVGNHSAYRSVKPLVEQVQLLYGSLVTRSLCSLKDPWVICWLLKSEKQFNKRRACSRRAWTFLVCGFCVYSQGARMRGDEVLCALAGWLIDFTLVKPFKKKPTSRLSQPGMASVPGLYISLLPACSSVNLSSFDQRSLC